MFLSLSAFGASLSFLSLEESLLMSTGFKATVDGFFGIDFTYYIGTVLCLWSGAGAFLIADVFLFGRGYKTGLVSTFFGFFMVDVLASTWKI